jgi:hypothetical protein
MSFDYLSLQVTANRLIEQFGQTATISRQAASGATPWAPTLTETGYEVKAVMLDYSAREIDATDILRHGPESLCRGWSIADHAKGWRHDDRGLGQV